MCSGVYKSCKGNVLDVFFFAGEMAFSGFDENRPVFMTGESGANSPDCTGKGERN